ncbi:hypothetical protein [Spirosoma pollinicola]|uniref:Uncharacterized protein n=1 Tax=Spirosoma pollinicola TaxID=2057025 RepID=A0A2K8YT37_9BACT|nr:hypothetical protein [Spirosoma pollinicola]AUD00786.1 hypothetical protein CWM47_02515 [Spirosoma pollinicola]
MNTTNYSKTGWLTVVLVLTFVIGWERYWRHENYVLSYNDDESLWSSKRKQVYQSSHSRPVLIGSSRIKFDLDLATWERITGEKPIQLSMPGTSPRPFLTDLGNDPNFKGTLLIDVTEPLFFTPTGSFPEQEAIKRVKAYPNWSLSQQISFQINHVLEANFVFLDDLNLALGPLLTHLPIPNRLGTWGGPTFPYEFGFNQFDRQTKMWPAFVADTNLQRQVKNEWVNIGSHSPKEAIAGPPLEEIFKETRQSVNQIRARGGKVVFIRTPSDGPMRDIENKMFPRAAYWDRLLSYTNTPGIHAADYPALSRFTCPEWSHLTPKDAVFFTQDLLPVIEQKMGWSLQRNPSVSTFRTPSSTL